MVHYHDGIVQQIELCIHKRFPVRGERDVAGEFFHSSYPIKLLRTELLKENRELVRSLVSSEVQT